MTLPPGAVLGEVVGMQHSWRPKGPADGRLTAKGGCERHPAIPTKGTVSDAADTEEKAFVLISKGFSIIGMTGP